MATKKDNALTAFMLVQQLDNEYWRFAAETPAPPSGGFDGSYDEEYNAQEREKYNYEVSVHDGMKAALETARKGDVAPLAAWVADRLASCGVSEVHGILHDKDTLTEWDTSKNEYVQTAKATHVHILVSFAPQKAFDSSRTLANVAFALGVAPQYIERPKKGRFAVDNMLSYLIHVKYVDKHQYTPEEVVSLVPEGAGGETYSQIYARRRQEWMQGRGEVSRKRAALNIEALVDDVSNGKITKQQILLTDELFLIYSRNRRRINDAFASNLERKVLNIENDMKAGKFRLSIFFVTGEAGHGKSLFADFFAAALQRFEKNKTGAEWQIYDAATANSMDDYQGEEILILDDLRARSMRPEDWLRLLDPYRTKTAPARFYNKTPICRTLILTSIKEPFEFFDDAAQTTNEDLNQFIRRISAKVQVVNMSEIFANAQIKIGEVKKVTPFSFGLNEKPLVFDFENDKREYTPMDAVKRLLEIVEKSSAPTPSPFPEGWETKIFEPLAPPPENEQIQQIDLML